MFGQIADARERRFVAHVVPEHRAFGVARADDRHHDLDQRALAGAVGAEQAEDLAARDLHRHALECVHFALVGLANVAQIDCEVSHCHHDTAEGDR